MKVNYLARRTTAYFVDCIIAFTISMLFIQGLIMINLQPYLGIDDQWFRNSINMEIYVLLTISLPVWLYFAIMESSEKRATLGKRLVNLEVLNSTTTNKINFTQSISRTILKLLPWEIAHIGVIFPTPLHYAETAEIRTLTIIGLVLFVVYFVSIALDQQSRSLYDKWVGTTVAFVEKSPLKA